MPELRLIENPDAPVIEWEREIRRTEERLGNVDICSDEYLDSIREPTIELERRIAQTEAFTIHGLAVKFRRLIHDWQECGEMVWTEEAIRTLQLSFDRPTEDATP